MIKQTIIKMVWQTYPKRQIFIVLVVFFMVYTVSAADNIPTKRPTVGLVLSGGGAKGLAHIGVLKVLEEAGVPVDYIGGTSMGSIVAGLYAMGYSSSQIEEMVVNQDWVALLADQLKRTNLTVTEKEDFDKYIVSFPLDSLRIKLPSGLGAGQNVSLLLSRMALPVADMKDFNEFPRSFLCVAMDIVTGKEVVLRSGYLPDAIRASMAIPSVFTPVEIDDYYLVDGGLVNNFPVDHVKAMGADIIIGVNLGLKEYSKKDLENLAAVLEQSLFIKAKDRNLQNQQLCDILLSPKVYSSSAASFNNVKELIAAGEKVAREKLPVFKHLADSLNTIEKLTPIHIPAYSKTLNVKEIHYDGLSNVTPHFLKGKLRLRAPSSVTVSDIEAGIERAFGTQFFSSITYKVNKLDNDSVRITFRVNEKSNDLLRVGARFDSEFKAQLLLNATLRNKFIKGTKLSIDVFLSVYPRIKAEYRINSGWHNNREPLIFRKRNIKILPDLGFNANYNYFVLNYYNSSHQLTATYQYEYLSGKAFVSSSLGNPLYVEGGLNYEYSFVKSIIASDAQPANNRSFDVYTKIIFDSQNDQVFPTRGGYLKLWGDAVSDKTIEHQDFFNIYRVGINLKAVLQATEFLHFQPYAKSGVAFGDTVPPLQNMILGGNNLELDDAQNIYSFTGFRFMETIDKGFYTVGLKLRLTAFKKHHITIDNVTGRTDPIPDLYTQVENPIYGFGLSYGYKSFIGPIEAGVYKSNQNIPWQFFINIGYWF